MALHPEYADLVKTALVSDTYWQNPDVMPFTHMFGNALTEAQMLRTRTKLTRSEEHAQNIGSVLMSLEGGGRMMHIPYGDEIPIPHHRQVVKVIEDSRETYSKLSPLQGLLNAVQHHYYKQAKKIAGPDYQEPTFEEDLAAIHTSVLPFGFPAKEIVEYGTARRALLQRSAYYLQMDEASGMFVGLPSSLANMPMLWQKPVLELIPPAKVGEIYSKEPDNDLNHLGRIISATVIEAHGITWKTKGKPRGENKKDKRVAKGFLPRIAHST
jgi:hypothetical protein